jgi:hypothetical protein
MPVPERELERVIKDRRTGGYYVRGGVWTVNARDARVFEDLGLALEVAQNEGLRGCSIIVFRGGFREVDAQFPID